MKTQMKTISAVLALSALSSVAAYAADSAVESGFKFQINLDYVTGLHKMADKIEQNNSAVSITNIPVGMALNGTYEFGNDFGVGLDVGPCILGAGDASFFVIPIGLDVRYDFIRQESFALYAKAGIEKAFASGDFIDNSSKLGFFGVLGVEFGHCNSFSWGFEAGYNSTAVEVKAGDAGTKAADVKPYEFTIGAFVRF